MRRAWIIGMSLFMALGVSLWLLWRTRAPGRHSTPAPYQVELRGMGVLFTYRPDKVPVSQFSWATGEASEPRTLWISLQNGQALLTRMDQGGLHPPGLFQRPGDIPESFFHLCTLHRTFQLREDRVFLHFVSLAHAPESSLLALVEPSTGRWLWHQRTSGVRSRWLRSGASTSFWVYGDQGPLTLLRWDQEDVAFFHPSPEPVEPPAADALLWDILPLPQRELLVAHAQGLSNWTSEEGWKAIQTPPISPLFRENARGVLARGARGVSFWQPHPGSLYRVESGPEGVTCTSLDLPETPSGFALDQALLRLQGMDPQGLLWFDLCRPDQIPSKRDRSATFEDDPERSRQGAVNHSFSPSEDETWKTYLSRPLNRSYAWRPEDAALRVIEWANILPRLGVPPEAGSDILQVHPEENLVATSSSNPAWWMSLPRILELQVRKNP